MKPVLVLLFISTLLLACSKKDIDKKLPEPVQAIIDSGNCVCEPYIKKCVWRDKTVYVIGYYGSACNWTPGYFDEKGNPVMMEEGYNMLHFLYEAAYVKLIWECKK